MLQRLVLFGWLLVLYHNVSGQDTARKRLSALVSPALVPLSNTELALQPGLEARLGRWSLVAQLAFPLHKPTSQFASVRYLRKSIELKHYFKQRARQEEYLSAEALHAQRRFTDTNGGTFFKSPYNTRYGYSQAHINAPVFVFAIKAGMVFPVGKRFFIDGFAGLGVRTIYTRYSQVSGEAERPYGLIEISLPKSALRYDRTSTKPHMTCGFKLGYVLW